MGRSIYHATFEGATRREDTVYGVVIKSEGRNLLFACTENLFRCATNRRPLHSGGQMRPPPVGMTMMGMCFRRT